MDDKQVDDGNGLEETIKREKPSIRWGIENMSKEILKENYCSAVRN